MATNNFKPFATAANANVMSQTDWEALPALLSGFISGPAKSAQVNKAIRQASFIAAALAQYTANKSGLDVLDDGDLNGFISKMGTAFGKDFQALDATLTALAGLATGANKLPYFTGNDTAAQTDLTSVGRDIIGKNTIADILTYLGLSKSRFAVVTSSQAITIPNWVTEIYVTASAGGGGGGGSGGSTNLTGTGAGGQGGGSGEFVVKRKFAVTPGSTINVTIGAGGAGGIAGTPSINGGNGAAGGGTVVGSLLTLNGGGGGHGGDSFMGSVLPGGGAGGTGYPAGQDGQDGANTILGNGCGGNGGNSFFGGGAGGSRAGSAGVDGKDAYGYGSGGSGAGGGYGGSGGGSNGGVGGKGSSGIVIIEW